MPIIYVIEQLIDGKWVGIQTNFFNSIKNKSVPDSVRRALNGSINLIVGIEGYPASEMTNLLNKFSPQDAHTISIDQYRAMVFRALTAEKKKGGV